jgi:isocitrate dehydrogenase
VRYAFEYARRHSRKKVTCFTKDNIMKMTDGLFHKIFDEIAAQYPEIQNEHWIVDIGAAKMADTPEAFDVIVMPNLYGDILSDVAAQIAGSVGIAGSANIGEQCAMFEAIHGSAPRRANQNLANPSGLLLGSVLMLVHINQPEVAARVHNAWLRTIEDGVHTYDIFTEGSSKEKVGTREFAGAVVERLGKKPNTLNPVAYAAAPPRAQAAFQASSQREPKVDLVGVDVYVNWPSLDNDKLAAVLQKATGEPMALTMMSNRGLKIWPGGHADTFCTDNYRCRFAAADGVTQAQIVSLLGRVADTGVEIVKTENLRHYDGRPGYTLAQGE